MGNSALFRGRVFFFKWIRMLSINLPHGFGMRSDSSSLEVRAFPLKAAFQTLGVPTGFTIRKPVPKRSSHLVIFDLTLTNFTLSIATTL